MRLIDADALKATFCAECKLYDGDLGCTVPDCVEHGVWHIWLMPTIEAEPVRHGRWELIDEAEPRRYGCSECKRMVWHTENYCPNCGAKMDEVENERKID